jgi:putative ABC transport system permease protein
LRVLGYTRREVQRLIDTENRVLALLGTVGGVPLGIFLFGWIADLVSTPDFIMSKEPNLLVILISIVMLFGFMEFTNLLLRGKVTKIKLVESLKGVE